MDLSDWNEVLTYDGECRFCHGSVNFILKHEKDSALRFAWLQSEKTKELLSSYKSEDIPDSIILVKDGKILFRSEAGFRILEHIAPPYSWLRIFRFLPTSFTDWIYDMIAGQRRRLMGRMSCTVPSKTDGRFLE